VREPSSSKNTLTIHQKCFTKKVIEFGEMLKEVGGYGSVPEEGEGMVIGFDSRQLEKVFNSSKKLQAKYGARMAKDIEEKVTFLEAVATLQGVPETRPFRRHKLKGKRNHEYAIDLIHPFRLIFEPNHNPLPTMDDGGLDLARITSITILSVKDYH